MKLLNLSAGKVQVVQIGSEVVRTAHIKAPAREPWLITDDGVDGDERAVHPDKLYAFSRQAYDYWGEHLGVDPRKWPDGFFGENLTLDALDETSLRVGDVFTLGNEVRLFVAGARNPCVKLAWRLSQPLSFQKLFARSRHAGAYFGVEQGGRVHRGDTLRRVEHDPSMPSVAEVSNMIVDATPPPLDRLRRALGCEQLSPTNRFLLTAKLDAAERAADAVESRWRGWRPFRIDRVVNEATDIRSIYLVAADGGALCQQRPGHFVSVRMRSGERLVTRSWSLSSFAHAPKEYRLTVRRQGGAGSQWLHEAEVGTIVDLRAPSGPFTLDPGGYRPVVLVAAGIGITPLMAMLHAHLARPGAPPVHLIYGGRAPGALAFRGELEALAASRPDFRLTLVYSRAQVDGALHGRITPELIIALLADLHVHVGDHRADLPWFEADLYICGPGDFCVGIRDVLVARGGNPDRIFHELFAAAPIATDSVERATVTFARSGAVAEWTADADLPLLELAEQAGANIASSCRAGSCLTCRCRVLEGTATVDLGDGTTLPCVARPATETLVLDA